MAWAMVAGAAISVVGGAVAQNKAKKGANQQNDYNRRMAEWSGEGKRESGYEYGNELDRIAQDYRAYSQRPGMFSNGYGSSYIDPTTGRTSFALNSDYQGLRDQALGGAASMFDQAGNFDPRESAKERYNSAQALLAPSDSQAQQGLMQDLYNKGGFGLTTNQTSAPVVGPNGEVTTGTGTAGVNPYVSTFMNARNQRDANMAYGSLREGEQYLDGLINRGSGMFRLGQSIDQLGVGSMNDAFNYRNQFDQDYMQYLRLRDGGARARRDGRDGYYNAVGGVQKDAGAGANADAQMWQTGTNAVGGMFSNGSLNGLFGGGGYSVNTTALPSSYYGGSSSTWGPGVGF